jgi:hypothetical protein
MSEPQCEQFPSYESETKRSSDILSSDTGDPGFGRLELSIVSLTHKVSGIADQIDKLAASPGRENVRRDIEKAVKTEAESDIKKFLIDLTERVVSTFFQGFIGSFFVTRPLSGSVWYAALGGGVAAVLSLGKGILARTRGDANSASLFKKS